MTKYRLSNEAKADLINIHQYGIIKFGVVQADKYFYSFYDCFELIAQRPYTNLTPKYAYKICSFSVIHHQKIQTELRL